MTEDKKDLKERIDIKVPIYLKKNSNIFDFDDESFAHLVSIGKSILYDKFDIIPGGGFVKAFNSNDLSLTYSKADNEIQPHIGFLLKMVYNIDLYN